MKRHRVLAAATVALAVLAALVAGLRLRSQVNDAWFPENPSVKEMGLVAVSQRAVATIVATSGDVEGVLSTPEGFLLAGGFGVARGNDRADITGFLPDRRMVSLGSWRGRPVVAAADGGVFVLRGNAWEQLRAGFGTLHVRALAEAPGGELLLGAREGLFRASYGGASIERLAAHPVRGLAVGENGAIVSGGEKGAFRTSGRKTEPLESLDPWIDTALFAGRSLYLVTARGLEAETSSGFAVVEGGRDVTQAVAIGDDVFALTGESAPTILRRTAGRWREEVLPSRGRRLFVSEGSVLVDTAAGLVHRTESGFRPVSPRPASTPEGPLHVGALSRFDGRLVVGLFDGGLYFTHEDGASVSLREVKSPSVWGVNALLPAGGALFVASLRGASRYDGARLEPLEGPGAAFALASTPQGVAIGYGQGVRLGDQRLFSAFHGLPGNQALALLSSDALYVGTPSGLGAVAGARVLFRVAAGDGELPHPWVTALAETADGLHIATYGGGVARRRTDFDVPSRGPRFETYPETAGFKVNPGCLVEAKGRLFLGTDDRGLFVREEGADHFEGVDVVLPSSRITALLAEGDTLFVGTDAGVARIPVTRR